MAIAVYLILVVALHAATSCTCESGESVVAAFPGTEFSYDE